MTPADAQAFGRIAFNIDVRHAQLGGKQIRSNRDRLTASLSLNQSDEHQGIGNTMSKKSVERSEVRIHRALA